MALVSVTKTTNDSAGISEQGQRATETYKVRYSVSTHTPSEALTAVGIPGYGDVLLTDGDPYLADIAAQSINVERDPEDPAFTFIVTVEYGQKQANFGGGGETQGGRTKWNWTVSISGSEFMETTNKQSSSIDPLLIAGDPRYGDNKAIVNINGDVYPSEIQKVGYDELINISYYTDSPPFSTIRTCRGKVNEAVLHLSITNTATGQHYTADLPARSVKLGNATLESVVDETNNMTVWRVNLPLIYREQRVDGANWYWLVGLVEKGYRVKDVNGKIIPSQTGEVFLDDDGKELNLNGATTYAEAVITYWDIEEPADFSGLFSA